MGLNKYFISSVHDIECKSAPYLIIQYVQYVECPVNRNHFLPLLTGKKVNGFCNTFSLLDQNIYLHVQKKTKE